MESIKDLTIKVIEARREFDSKSNKLSFEKAYEKFCNYFDARAKELDGYGYPVSITIQLRNGCGELKDFIMTFSPYEMRTRVVGFWPDLVGSKSEHLFYVFDSHPSDSEPCVRTEKNKVYIRMLDFVLLQALEQKEQIFEKFDKKIREDLQNYIDYKIHLSKLADRFGHCK